MPLIGTASFPITAIGLSGAEFCCMLKYSYIK